MDTSLTLPCTLLPDPCHGSGSTQHWYSGSQVPFSFPKLTATMQGPGNLSCRQVQAATGMAGVLSHPGGQGEGGGQVGANMGSKQ